MITYLYRASNLKSTITFLDFVSYRKSISSARQKPSFLAIFFIIIIFIIQHLFIYVFYEYTWSQHHLYQKLPIFLRFVLL